MSSQSRSRLVPILSLIVLVGVLGGVVYRQYVLQQEAEQKRQAFFQDPSGTFHPPPPPPRPVEKNFEQLAEERRPDAEAARPAIVALVKKRSEESRFWPKLSVPMLPSAKTIAAVREGNVRYRLRELDAYRQHTRDTAAAKAAGEVFLEAYITQVASRELREEDEVALLALGQAAIEAGSQDPLLRTYYTVCRHAVTQDDREAVREWEAAAEELPNAPYPPIVLSYARLFLRDIEHDFVDRSPRSRDALPAVMAWLEHDATQPEWIVATARRFWSIFEKSTENEQKELAAACLKSTKVDPYFAHTAVGFALIEHGWRARGSGWAHEVKPRDQELFDQYLRLAATHLRYAWHLHPELPYAPEQMIRVSMGGGDDASPHFWFLQAIHAQFDYSPAYSSLGYAMTSRWNGSRKEMYTIGHNCIETLRFETPVPYLAIEILKRVQEMELDEGESLADDPEAKKLLRRFLELRQAYLSDRAKLQMYEESGRYRADLVMLLEDCQLHDAAATVLRETNGNLNWTSLRAKNREGRFLAARRVALQSTLGERILAFDQKLQSPWNGVVDGQVFDELATELQTLRTESVSASEPITNFPDYFSHAEVMLAHRRQYNSGEWFDLGLSSSLAGWEPYADRWTSDPEAGVVLSSRNGSAPQVLLRPLISFPLPLEVECDAELLEPPPYLQFTGIGWSRAGMVPHEERGAGLMAFGLAVDIIDQPERCDFTSVESHPAQARVGFPLRRTGTHRLRLKLWPEYAEYGVDETWTALPFKNGMHPEGWLCFGEFLPKFDRKLAHRGRARFDHIRLRRLSLSAPPPASAPLMERAAYWEHRQQVEPQDPLCTEQRAKILGEQRQDSEALAIVNSLLREEFRPLELRMLRAWLISQQGRYAESIAEYAGLRREFQSSPEVAWRYADLLSTVPDPALRDGPAALETAQFLMKYLTKDPDRKMWQALASAHAEVGDFSQAVSVQQQAMEAEETVADALSAVRLEHYRSAKPWRHPEAASP